VAEQRPVSLTKITISGSEVEIRHAVTDEIGVIKRLFDEHKRELGFVVKAALENSIARRELLVAVSEVDEVIGAVHYRHCKDGQTTLYSIVVDSAYRSRTIGRALLHALKHEASNKGQKSIQLKCPAELEANKFYEAERFLLVTVEPGRRRPLNVWRLLLESASNSQNSISKTH
jgi:N-acetylglutamate synthase-like GNAT family acetyltransferase